MATSQQGKKKKKVLSQQQIDKLLGMLREEDKPLRAGILAKTLGYQSAKDINPTLLRLEGYGMVSRVTMNNTPLWKYVSREGIAAMTATSPRVEEDLVKEDVDMARLHIIAGSRLPHENCTVHQVIDVREDSCPSRPQSTKVDLEWDPSDIQAHREEGGGLHLGDDYHAMTAYSNNGTFTAPGHSTKAALSTMHLADTAAGLQAVNGAGGDAAAVLCFSANQGYAAQDIYSAIDAQQEQLHTTTMNGLGAKMAATTNGQSFVGQDYVGMSAYNGTGDAHLNGGTNLNSAMQNNYNVEYGHQSSPQSESGSRGCVNGSDMYMSNGAVQHHVSNGIGGNNSIQANHQNFLLNSGSQVHSDYGHSNNNNYRSSMPPSTPPHKSTAASTVQQQQGYSRADTQHHFNHNSYNTSSSSLGGRMPTYVMQEILKPESVGQYGMTAAQGTPDARQVGGYQALHAHSHPHGLDAGPMPPYSGQPFHTTAGPNNGGPSAQHQHPQHPPHLPHSQHQPHHHHQQQQQQPLTQAANFVNVGNFAGATYNQYQGTYGLGTPGRPYSGQHQSTGYSSAGLGPGKDLANYSGNNGTATYHGSHLNKRQHFNGYTGAGMFTNHVRPPIYPPGKMGGHARSTPFQKQSGFSRSQHSERQRGGHPHGRARFGLQGRGGPGPAHEHCEDGKGKHASIYAADKEAAKMEANKYMGTEVLDDICRRLANQASVHKKNANVNSEESAKDAEEANTVEKDEDSKEKEQDKNSEKSKSDSVIDTDKILPNSKKDKDSSKNPCSTNDEKVLTNGKDHSSSVRVQNSNRGYGGKQYPVRGGYYGRDASRYHQHHRNSSRNCNGRTKCPTESVTNGKLTHQNEHCKNVSESAANEKAGESKEEKDATQGSENITAVEVKYSTVEASCEQVQDERPMAKYRVLLLDHLDPNNVLLSHLFVRGLIDRVLVDQVRRMKTRRDAMEVLLPALLTIPQEAVNTGFCDALQKSGQVYLAELIKAAGLAGCMSEQHAAYLKLHQQNIAASMIPDKELLTYLRTDSVLTHDLHRFVSTQPSRAQQIDTLLQVLPFRGDKAFETFRTALRRSGQPWLAEQIAMELT